ALLPLIHSDPQGLMTAKAIRTSESDRVRRAERRPAERRQERLGGRVALTFAATMEFPQDVWRALLNRRTYDLGFLSLQLGERQLGRSMLGQWAGAKHEPLQPALLEISCGRVRVYA
ncbi:unnamed protein product, partial [Durusdinium trenchii]